MSFENVRRSHSPVSGHSRSTLSRTRQALDVRRSHSLRCGGLLKTPAPQKL
ncbi:MAG: hypothetical protein AAF810_17750 [Cyanobacteria bacterium P01_D01_bin.36]